jgi:hypothetical protein
MTANDDGYAGKIAAFMAIGFTSLFAEALASGIVLLIVLGLVVLSCPIYGMIDSGIGQEGFALSATLFGLEVVVVGITYVLFRRHDYRLLGHIANFLIDSIGWIIVLAVLGFASLWLYDKAKHIN